MVGIQLDASETLRYTKVIARQLPYGTAKALNEMALLFQKVQQRHQARKFTIRRKTWWHQAIKIPKKDGFADAKKGRLESRVITDPKQDRAGVKHYDIFWRQEYDRHRVPILGRKSLALPRKGVQRDVTGVVRRPERPKRVMAKKGSFEVKFASGVRGLFRRVGKRSKRYVTAYSHRARGGGAKVRLDQDPNVEFLYFLIPDADIDPVFEFHENAERVWRGNWQRSFHKNVREAFRTARV